MSRVSMLQLISTLLFLCITTSVAEPYTLESKSLPIPLAPVVLQSELDTWSEDGKERPEPRYIPQVRIRVSLANQIESDNFGFVIYVRSRAQGPLQRALPLCVFSPRLDRTEISDRADCITTELDPGDYEVFARTLGLTGRVSIVSPTTTFRVMPAAPDSIKPGPGTCVGTLINPEGPQPGLSVSRSIYFDIQSGELSGDHEEVRIAWDEMCFGGAYNYRRGDLQGDPGLTGFAPPRSFHVFWGDPMQIADGFRPRIEDLITWSGGYLKERLTFDPFFGQRKVISRYVGTFPAEQGEVLIKRRISSKEAWCAKECARPGYSSTNLCAERWTVIADIDPQTALVDATLQAYPSPDGSVSFDSELLR